MNSLSLSIVGCEYPSNASNIVSAACFRNARPDDATANANAVAISEMGVEDISALQSEIFSIALVCGSFVRGELSGLNLDPARATKAVSALRTLKSTELSDDAFLNTIGDVAFVWPDIIDCDLTLTKRHSLQSKAGMMVDKDQAAIDKISPNILQNFAFAVADAADVITLIRNYVYRLGIRTSLLSRDE